MLSLVAVCLLCSSLARAGDSGVTEAWVEAQLYVAAGACASHGGASEAQCYSAALAHETVSFSAACADCLARSRDPSGCVKLCHDTLPTHEQPVPVAPAPAPAPLSPAVEQCSCEWADPSNADCVDANRFRTCQETAPLWLQRDRATARCAALDWCALALLLALSASPALLLASSVFSSTAPVAPRGGAKQGSDGGAASLFVRLLAPRAGPPAVGSLAQLALFCAACVYFVFVGLFAVRSLAVTVDPSPLSVPELREAWGTYRSACFATMAEWRAAVRGAGTVIDVPGPSTLGSTRLVSENMDCWGRRVDGKCANLAEAARAVNEGCTSTTYYSRVLAKVTGWMASTIKLHLLLENASNFVGRITQVLSMKLGF